MGYSCLAIANYAASALEAELQGDASWTGNGWTIDGTRYFWERGREQADAAIVGTVWKMVGDGKCRRAGSVRIDSEGIKRWPTSTKAQRDRAWKVAQKQLAHSGMLPRL